MTVISVRKRTKSAPFEPDLYRGIQQRLEGKGEALRESGRNSGLEAVIEQGARRRQHRTFQFVKSIAPAVALGSVAAALIYLLVMVSAGRSDWFNIGLGASATGLIPLISGSLIVLVARRNEPVTIALASTIFASALVVSVLAATRIPISFTAILAALPVAFICVSFANVSLAREISRSVALLDFEGASAVSARIGIDTLVISPESLGSDVDKVLIDSQAHHTPEFASVLARLYLRGAQLEPWPTFLERRFGKVEIDTFDLSDVAYSPSQIAYYRSKRLFDVVAVCLLALPAGIIAAAIWLYIRLVDGKPGIFVQQRRGYGGSTFNLYKFRTMYRGNNVGSTEAHDPRILPGCRLLRQIRLDELPQLINILRGEMSFIGPRPVSIPVAEELEAKIPQYVSRQILLPGLTGWAQVSQGYAFGQDEETTKLEYDLYYLKYVSLDLDVIILVRTIKTIVLRLGAR